MYITRTFDLLKRYDKLFNKPDALVSKKDGKWIEISSQQYIDNSYNISYGLLAKGFKKGYKIASISSNCPEWNMIDMGMAMAGIVHVPVFTTLNQSEFKYIFQHAGVKLLFVSDTGIYNNVNEICNELNIPVYAFNDIESTTSVMLIIN